MSKTTFADGGKPDTCHFDSTASRRLFLGMSTALTFLKSMSAPPQDLMAAYRARKDSARTSVKSKYHIMGFISSGTYGRVYKAHAGGKFYAIKKFKPEKEGELLTYTGISQSAIREIAVWTGNGDR
jgi:serine/threonine protein kinase